MAHTFEIRFVKSAGLAGLFEAPANRLGWKGAGRLSVDDGGIHIAVRRGIANWFQRSKRIQASDLTQVFREGEALRLEYGTDSQRQVLPIWASGSEAAERIVRLLPTTRTVELEQSSSPRRFRWDRKMLAWSLVLVALVGAAWIASRYRTQESAVAVAPERIEASRGEAPAAVATSIPAPAPAILSAEPPDAGTRRQTTYHAELTLLRNRYAYLQEATSADQLAAIKPEWWSTDFQIDDSESLSGPAFTGYREAQLAALSNWRAALSAKASAIRLKDDRFVELAERQRELAERYEVLVAQYVR
jgi:hypothetical protein